MILENVGFTQGDVRHYPGLANELVRGVVVPQGRGGRPISPLEEGGLRDELVSAAEAVLSQLPPAEFGKWSITEPQIHRADGPLPLHTDPGFAFAMNVTISGERDLVLAEREIRQYPGDVVTLMGVFATRRTQLGSEEKITGVSLPGHESRVSLPHGFFANISIVNRALAGQY